MGYETEKVHPATEELLKSYRWHYRHEVTIPGAGRADFVVYGTDKQPLVVIECKAHRKYISEAVSQVQRYQGALKCPKAIIVVPKETITPRAIKFAEKNNVLLWGVKIPKAIKSPEELPKPIIIPYSIKVFPPPTNEEIRIAQERSRVAEIWNRIKLERKFIEGR